MIWRDALIGLIIIAILATGFGVLMGWNWLIMHGVIEPMATGQTNFPPHR